MKNQILPHDHGYNEKKVAEHMPTEEEIAGVSEAMKQLGDPSRLRIFWHCCSCQHEQPRSLSSSEAVKKQRPDRKPPGRKRNVLPYSRH